MIEQYSQSAATNELVPESYQIVVHYYKVKEGARNNSAPSFYSI